SNDQAGLATIRGCFMDSAAFAIGAVLTTWPLLIASGESGGALRKGRMMRYHTMNFRNLAIIISAILFTSTIASGQKRARPKPKTAPTPAAAPAPTRRPVSVTLKKGDEIEGNFLRADTETMEVEVRSGRLTIKMSDVSSLFFIDEGERPAEEEEKDPAPPAPDPGLQAGRKAFAALQKLAEAAKIKLPVGDYGNLLIDTKPVIDEALMDISDYSLKNAITRTLEAYYDAGQAGGAARAYETRQTFGAPRVIEQGIPVDSEPGATLMKKYQIKAEVNRLAQADHLKLDEALKAIWAVAGERLNYVASMIRQ
ncbi:MAG: hypothetical protein J2P21_29075, partial [Chloracidobacterium sp.]|nr:hypothetical protein [Chloracidobacterium sp.]